MENKVDISVILPIASSFGKDFDILFEKAIDSIKKQQVSINELIIVHSDEESLCTKLNSFDFGDLNVVKVLNTSEHTDYASQVNLGVKNASSTWVSFFEHDDEYSFIWFKNVNDYIKYHPECDGFLPIVVDVDETDVFAGYTNEATFAANFTQEMGYLNNETLLDYQNFQTAGSVFKKEIIEDFGGFKPSIKLTFTYEFLLRLTHNGVRVMIVPRVGYQHVNLREDSLFWLYKNDENSLLSEKEVKFWLDSAKKEFFFKNKRDVNYIEA